MLYVGNTMQSYDHHRKIKMVWKVAVQNASNPIIHTCAKGNGDDGFLLIF